MRHYCGEPGDYNLNRLAIGKFILIGDHKQLPAVVSQPREMSRVTEDSLQAIGLTDCRNSLFERLHRLSSLQGTKTSWKCFIAKDACIRPSANLSTVIIITADWMPFPSPSTGTTGIRHPSGR